MRNPFANAPATEKWVIVSVLSILMSSYFLLFLAIKAFGSGVANCVANMKPFTTGQVIQHSPTHYEIHYVARMWSFDPPEVTIPPHANVDIYLTSTDVVHGFIIPGTNVNMMAVPGTVNYVRTRFDKTGDHRVICHEYCGTGHQDMSAVLHVGYRATEPEPKAAEEIPPGRRVLNLKGCVACHTLDGTPGAGPTLKGVFGSRVPLEDGSSVVADDAYLRESITQPAAKIVQGFQNSMPVFPLTDEELNAVLEYLRTLK